ncbi:MAG TPA: urea ABC transporter permease subunit UrtB [Opitutus sp.]|nr:urea ABC transporter permease subunit UrtB [Opitutus sp.]
MPALVRIFLCGFALALTPRALAETAREIIARAALATENAQRIEIITTLLGEGDEAMQPLFDAWKADTLFVYITSNGEKLPVQLIGEKNADGALAAVSIATGDALLDAGGQPLRLVPKSLQPVEHTSAVRRAMKAVLDLADLANPNLEKRVRAIQTLGYGQNAEKLSALQKRLIIETAPQARLALREAIALIGLNNASDEIKLASLKELAELHTIGSGDALRATLKQAEAGKKTELVTAAKRALVAIDNHLLTVNFFGTLFRGLSLGSILLVVALGLAITFGLMGVINMAHGEMIAVGAYTTYVVQNIFGTGLALSPFGFSINIPGINTSGFLYESYFLFALPLSFLAAAGAGILLERGIIRFLYRHPLESLLATWGVSMVLQQLFRRVFGSNNVQVSSPSFLSGNWTYNDIIFGWNRVFVIGFAAVIVFGVYLVLTRTSLGLLIRAVMQNRNMASCTGVRTERVNMLTFGLGSGLAGLAGAFLSQIGNVGPSLGQNYIVDCFMTVVVGGVGNLPGTVIAALGIGMADQSLQQILLNPVLGKITVLIAIILFLQWRPAGIFVTKSRSLEG